MKTEIVKISRLLPVCLLLLFAAVSCVVDNDAPRGSGDEDTGEDKSVTFSLALPGQASAGSTYALAPSDEVNIKSFDVLLFDAAGMYKTTRTVPESSITSSSSAGSTVQDVKSFTIKIPEGTYKHVVVLANCREILLGSSVSTSDNKEDALAKLTLYNNTKWNANSSSYTPIPMWGELGTSVVNQATSSGSQATPWKVDLTRMIAKVSITVSAAAASDFVLKSVHVYNYYDMGSVAPKEDNWGSEKKATVPLRAEKPTAQSPYTSLKYEYPEVTSAGTSYEIYLFESDNKLQTDLLDRTCLVLGGVYNSKTYYYRVDFVDKTSGASGDTYLDIIRNRHYMFNVTGIGGQGFDTPDDAFKARPFNIEARVIEWDDAEIRNIATDGQYLLGVSQRVYNLKMDQYTIAGTDNKLSIVTDYPDGWTITSSDPTWLTLSKNSGNKSASLTPETISLILTQNTTGAQRTATLSVTAGNITIYITVTQSTEADLSLSLRNYKGEEITELLFHASAGVTPPTQSFYAFWAPKANECTISSSPVGSHAFNYAGSGGVTLGADGLTTTSGSGTGEQQFIIAPPAMTTTEVDPTTGDPFKEKVSDVTFTIANGSTPSLNKLIRLKQVNYAAIASGYDGIYLMDGGTKSFAVRANTSFTVEAKAGTNTGNVISFSTSSYSANTSSSGTSVYFNIIDDITSPTIYQRYVTVIIKSPQGLFPDTEIVLNCVSGIAQGEANSYIVKPSGAGILIPVSRCNKSEFMLTQLVEGDVFTADLVWTDNSKGQASDSNIKDIMPIGTGPSGQILVIPGSGEGNAVVAVKKSGKILWSWHIWVTNEVPAVLGTHGFMDRNLGAIGNAKNAVKTKGLLYQWGRKDPFPGANDLSGATTPVPLWNASRGSVSIETVLTSTTNTDSYPYNVPNTFAKPTTYYYYGFGTGVFHDWYSSNTTTHNSYLWNDTYSKKTIYDPCPSGWRVPPRSGGISPWNGITTDVAWDTTNYGITNNAYGGFYPAAGYRSYYSGDVSAGTGWYWSATASTTNASVYILYFSIIPSSLSPDSDLGLRADGCSVRCVAE